MFLFPLHVNLTINYLCSFPVSVLCLNCRREKVNARLDHDDYLSIFTAAAALLNGINTSTHNDVEKSCFPACEPSIGFGSTVTSNTGNVV